MSTNTRRDAVLTALVSGSTIKGAARLTGVNEKTIRKWLSESEYSGKVAEARADVTRSILASLKSKAETAITTLDDIMTGQKVSAHAKVQAARTIIEYAVKSIETVEVIERIEELERHAAEEDR